MCIVLRTTKFAVIKVAIENWYRENNIYLREILWEINVLICREHTRQLDRSSLVWLPWVSGRLLSQVVEPFIPHQKHVLVVNPEPVNWGLADLAIFFLGVAYILP